MLKIILACTVALGVLAVWPQSPAPVAQVPLCVTDPMSAMRCPPMRISVQ